MQFSEATARAAGLRVVRSTRFKIATERKLVRRKHSKPVYRTVRHRPPYTVMVRDDRLNPEILCPEVVRPERESSALEAALRHGAR